MCGTFNETIKELSICEEPIMKLTRNYLYVEPLIHLSRNCLNVNNRHCYHQGKINIGSVI